MSEPSAGHAIEITGLSKIYRIYPSPMHRVREIIFRKVLHSDFVVLEDINLTIDRGETFGIIGENGAGKSTLLKIIAKTLKPTTGEVRTRGRISALLELGAGFNPELTGEENIYLNAYLVGLTKTEIDARKQQIIDFSELGDFIGRPVKTYSSGMHVRLAFSIATSVDPDILIIDEALAVGDQHYQKKCVDHMMKLKETGKTILFCSHSLYLVQELCGRAMWMKNGRIEKMGRSHKVINAYTDWVRAKDASMEMVQKGAPSAAESDQKLAWLEDVKVANEDGGETDFTRTGEDLCLSMVIRVSDMLRDRAGHIGFSLYRNDDEPVFAISTKMDGLPATPLQDGGKVLLTFPAVPLLAGQYYFLAAVMDENAIHIYDIQRTKMFQVENIRGELGITKLAHDWQIRPPEKSGQARG